MQIKQIELAWFRGAADAVKLAVEGKSAVIYGENGAGKSSFVDAIEYLISGGKLVHLTHEYSGKKQEKGLINTHIPAGKQASVSLTLISGASAHAQLQSTGAVTLSGTAVSDVGAWQYRQTVLRQDEVSSFIASPKGNKYSALLPLLGLGSLECAAENLRQLAKCVEKTARLPELKTRIAAVQMAVTAAFPTTLDKQSTIGGLYSKYCDGSHTGLHEQCDALKGSLDTRVNALNDELKRHLSLAEIAEVPIGGAIQKCREAAVTLAALAEPLIEERLTVLEKSLVYATAAEQGADILCPACGQEVNTEELTAHLKDERARLIESGKAVLEYRKTRDSVASSVQKLQDLSSRKEVAEWRAKALTEASQDTQTTFPTYDIGALRDGCDEGQLNDIGSQFLPLVTAAKTATAAQPPEASEIALAQKQVDAMRAAIEILPTAIRAEAAEALVAWLTTLEVQVRAAIRLQSEQVMADISGDIQRMWGILHPHTAIEDVRLCQTEDSDKAIDIELKFHGKDLASPRLTLSEGYRNSLGLCVFLAIAQRGDESDPIVLDDVVVSLDRSHRGMIVGLLEKEFATRQVLLFTHDRDWYAELRQLLDEKNWTFHPLRPYESPADGITWSNKTSTFGDARAQLKNAPDVAGNTTRKIMDTELGARAYRAKVRLPYLQSYRNDRRMAHEFLECFIADIPKALVIKKGSDYHPYTDAVAKLTVADKLLVAWGNKASHTFDVALAEASQLIDACEEALEVFVCPSCRSSVFKFDDSSGVSQCSCSQIRWKYGKL